MILDEAKRQCPKCRGRHLAGVWYSGSRGKRFKDIGLPEDGCEFLFHCKDCLTLSMPISVLADSNRWLAYTRPLKAVLYSVEARKKASYGSVAVECWQQGGWWYADALGFPALRTRGLTRELVATELRKKVERRVSAHYEKKTGSPWPFTDEDLEDHFRFTQGEEPPSDSSDDTGAYMALDP